MKFLYYRIGIIVALFYVVEYLLSGQTIPLNKAAALELLTIIINWPYFAALAFYSIFAKGKDSLY